MQFLHSVKFWRPFVLTLVFLAIFFVWQLGGFGDAIPKPPRPAPSAFELYYTIALIFFLSLNSGLAFFRMAKGTCPVGAKRATKIAGGLGIVTLLCPACLLIPVSLFGISLSLTFLAPFLPLLQIIVGILLAVSTILLWPKS